MAAGWPPAELAERLTANPHTARDSYAVLTARLADLADPPPAQDFVTVPAVRPPWCGHCDERTRLAEIDDGSLVRCPD